MRIKAFTLIELMIVVAIIGILVSIGIYGWSSAMANGRNNTRKTDLTRIANVLEQYYSDKRTYPVFFVPSLARDVGTYSNVNIFLAKYQLENSPDCSNDSAYSNKNDMTKIRLSPSYMSPLPEDPTTKTWYKTGVKPNCDNLDANQSGQYLYLSGPADSLSSDSSSGGPKYPATFYSLMATLENPNNTDRMADSQSPFLSSTLLGIYYNGLDDKTGIRKIDSNYILSNAFKK